MQHIILHLYVCVSLKMRHTELQCFIISFINKTNILYKIMQSIIHNVIMLSRFVYIQKNQFITKHEYKIYNI